MLPNDFNERLELFDKIFNEWHDWEQKFAWIPTRVDNKLIWLRKYYERRGIVFSNRVERALTVFDVLKNA